MQSDPVSPWRLTTSASNPLKIILDAEMDPHIRCIVWAHPFDAGLGYGLQMRGQLGMPSYISVKMTLSSLEAHEYAADGYLHSIRHLFSGQIWEAWQLSQLAKNMPSHGTDGVTDVLIKCVQGFKGRQRLHSRLCIVMTH